MRTAVAGIAALAFAFAIVPARAVSSDPSYATAKRAASAVLRPRLASEDFGAPRSFYDLVQCEPPDFAAPAETTRATIYADLAGGVLYWEHDLPKAGYPRRVWQPWVSQYEQAIVGLARRVPAQKFFAAWEKSPESKLDGLRHLLLAYRVDHPRLPEVLSRPEGCGGGEVSVNLVTEPAATQVSIIPAFFYELCRVQRIDPNDTARCAHWREVSGPIVQVSGDYHYVAKWHDGTVKRGMLDVEAASPLGTGTGTITLRKP